MRTWLWLLPLLVLAAPVRAEDNTAKNGGGVVVTKGAPAKGPSEKTFSQTLKNRTTQMGSPSGEQSALQGTAARKFDALGLTQQQAKLDKACMLRLADLYQSDSNVVRRVNAHGQSLLHEAAFAGYPVSAKFLMERGADPVARDLSGATPADLARRGGYPDVAALIERFRKK